LQFVETNLPILNDINMEVRDFELYGVIGSVGSGKTTLLQCIMKENFITNGSLKVNGSIAFVE
jgi:ATP-binding cassette subfamily C (CFTR/MRP) protein 4